MEDLEEEKRRTYGHGDDMRPASSGSPAAVPQPLQTSPPLPIPLSLGIAAPSAATVATVSAASASASASALPPPPSTNLPVRQPRKGVEENTPADHLGSTGKATLSGKVQETEDSAATLLKGPSPTEQLAQPAPQVKMLFTDLTKTGSAAHRRRVMATTSAFTDYEADLTNKDRAKAKEAVKKYLGERVQSNWEYEWPRTQLSRPSTCEDIDGENWQERDEWESNESVDEGEDKGSTLGPTAPGESSPYRFENPDGVGDLVRKSISERKRRRRKRLGDEMQWNDGVRCFVHRRNAWTAARRTPVPNSASHTPGTPPNVLAGSNDDAHDIDQIPIAPPLLPPENPIRAGIGPAAYGNIYDKVICQSQTPSVPINLKDVVRSCVTGWQRDGEWPPREKPVEPMMARKKSGGIRKSLQRVFGVGRREADI